VSTWWGWLTCGNAVDEVADLRRSFFHGLSGSYPITQSIFPTRSPETPILSRFSPDEPRGRTQGAPVLALVKRCAMRRACPHASPHTNGMAF
jgi:hypothetical protein